MSLSWKKFLEDESKYMIWNLLSGNNKGDVCYKGISDYALHKDSFEYETSGIADANFSELVEFVKQKAEERFSAERYRLQIWEYRKSLHIRIREQ